jgi:hypothetical protein
MTSLKRRKFLKAAMATGFGLGIANLTKASVFVEQLIPKEIRVGMVGLSVHSAAFSQILNDPEKKSDLEGCKVVALYHPQGNPDVDFSKEQLSKFEADIRQAGVKITASMKEMLDLVDVVMIETNDGRPHLEEVLPALQAGKTVFVDKPVAADLAGVLELYKKANEFKVPVFTSSALRYVENASKIDRSKVLSAFTYSPASLEKSHTDLFWYGIHGVELLYTVMGAGCKEVMQVQHTEEEDVVIGYWDNSRTGTVRGIRSGRGGFGGTVFMKDEIIALDPFIGYRPLVVKIVEFFKTNIPPVPVEETIEIYTFMEAAQESARLGGIKVSLDKTLKNAYKSINQ